jgi:hypothetical protein
MKARQLNKRTNILDSKYQNGFLTYFVKDDKVFYSHKNYPHIIKPSTYSLEIYKNKIKNLPHLWTKIKLNL